MQSKTQFIKINTLLKTDLAKHGKNYLFGNFMIQGLNFISIPILTRLLTPRDYGVISIFSSIIQIFTVLIGLNLTGAIARKYYESLEEEYGSFLYSNGILEK